MKTSFVKAVSVAYAAKPVLRVAGFVVDKYVLHQSRVRRASVPVCQIFTFHRVNEDGDPFLPATPTSVFKRQLEYLVRRFPVVGLEDLVNGRAWRYPYSCAI